MPTLEELFPEMAQQQPAPQQQDLMNLFPEMAQQQPAPQQDQEELLKQISRDSLGFELPPEITAGFIGAGKGLTDFGRGVATLAADIFGSTNPALRQKADQLRAKGKASVDDLAELKKEFPVSTTVGQVLGEAAPAIIPASGAGALATAGGRILGGALLGGAESGILEAGRGGDAADIGAQAGIGAALGGGIGTIGEGLGKAIKGFTGAIPKKEAAILAQADQLNIPVKTTDILPPDTAIGKLSQSAAEKIPVFGTAAARRAQAEARAQAVPQIAGMFNPVRPMDAAEDIANSLSSSAKKTLKAAGKRIGAYRGSIGEVPIDGTVSKIDEVIEGLQRKGVVTDPTAIKELEKFRDTLQEAPQTFDMLMTNRTRFRDIKETFTTAQRSQLPKFINTQLDDINRAMTDDLSAAVEKFGGERELKRWQAANSIYQQEAERLTKTRLKGVLDKAELRPEDALGLLFSTKRSEVKALYNALNSDGRAKARSAIIGRAMEKMGDDVSPSKFVKELGKMKDQLDVVFKPRERRELIGFKKLIEATQQAENATIATPTGMQNIPFIMGGAVGTQPMITIPTLFSAGMSARFYESKAVRNLLLRLSNEAVGTPKYQQIISQLTQQANIVAQAAKDEELGDNQ
ncbi:MAG: putative DNA transfer protein [Prokaryotic dsDNA virus sp.]|nr:hypothetical protein [Cytophagaceae bacterium]QDP54301.1 MAG: putative DNA transfer protein [Prokaryotic dsDNA virus sp.]|tara:strand:+ start:118 stop:2016 length:1899 start_codon:yes stop_codon:yes gene_type:complete